MAEHGHRSDFEQGSVLQHPEHERLKVLECYYSVSSGIATGRDLADILILATECLPAAFKGPGQTLAAIQFDGAWYSFAPFDEAQITASLSFDLIVNEEHRGVVQVGTTSDAPFLDYERTLVDVIGAQIASAIERSESEGERRTSIEKLERIIRERSVALEQHVALLDERDNALTKVEQELRANRTRLQALFDAVPDTALMIDRESNIVMSNRPLHETQQKCYQHIFERSDPCRDCPAQRVFTERHAVSQEKQFGDDYFVLQAFPLFDSQNEVSGAIEIVRKITREKNVEYQLLQTEKLASLGQLVSGVAHEINNPNTFIRGNIRIIQEAMDDIVPILDAHAQSHPDVKIARLRYDVFREHIPILIHDMVQGANRIKGLVEGLRTFARRDDGLLNETVDLNGIIETCLRLAGSQIHRTAKVTQELDPRIPAFRGNCQKLEQVFVNILINASQAIETKPGEILVKTWFDREAGEAAALIRDSGHGMDEETKAQIFDPFFTTKHKKDGTGLGISIANSIVKEHNGRIDVESEPGAGTTFIVRIPIPRKKGR